MGSDEIEHGSLVRIRDDPGRQGMVRGEPETQGARRTFKVFFGSEDVQWLSEDDLELVPGEP